MFAHKSYVLKHQEMCIRDRTKEYATDEYIPEALDAAKKLITDCESGGSTYGAYMYPTYRCV